MHCKKGTQHDLPDYRQPVPLVIAAKQQLPKYTTVNHASLLQCQCVERTETN
jgi:hypothetical protein